MGSEPKKTMWFVVVADRDVSKMGSEQRELEKFKVQGSIFLCLKSWGRSNDIVVAHSDAPKK